MKTDIEASGPFTDYIENWNRCLKDAVKLFKTSPATPIYREHPYAADLAYLILSRDASLCYDRAFESAVYFLRHLYVDEGETLISEMRSIDYLSHIDGRLSYLRDNKKFRTPYAIKNIRLHRLFADLLSDTRPKDGDVEEVWAAIRRCYIPKVSEIPSDIEWEV